MRLSRALLLSIAVTLVLTLLLQFIFGVMAFGLFLFVPLGFLFRRSRLGSGQEPDKRHGTSGPDSKPIEPK